MRISDWSSDVCSSDLVLARVFVAIIRRSKQMAEQVSAWVRVSVAGAIVAGTVLAGRTLSDDALTLRPGYDAPRWAIDSDRPICAIVLLGTLRVLGPAAVGGGGGVGGLFIPLVIHGGLGVRALGGVFDSAKTP